MTVIDDNRFGNIIPVELQVMQYAMGDTALVGFTHGQHFCTYSINLIDHFLLPEDYNYVFIKNYSDGKGAIDVLESQGIVERVKYPGGDADDGTVCFGGFDATAVYARIIDEEILDTLAEVHRGSLEDLEA